MLKYVARTSTAPARAPQGVAPAKARQVRHGWQTKRPGISRPFLRSVNEDRFQELPAALSLPLPACRADGVLLRVVAAVPTGEAVPRRLARLVIFLGFAIGLQGKGFTGRKDTPPAQHEKSISTRQQAQVRPMVFLSCRSLSDSERGGLSGNVWTPDKTVWRQAREGSPVAPAQPQYSSRSTVSAALPGPAPLASSKASSISSRPSFRCSPSPAERR